MSCATQTGAVRGGPARLGVGPRRPGRGLPAQHPRGGGGVPGHRLARRRLVVAARPSSASRSVVDRFAQIEPKVLFAVDGYRYGGKRLSTARDDVAEHRAAAARRCGHACSLPYLDPAAPDWRRQALTSARAGAARVTSACRSTIRSGSSTRPARPGLPKAIVHGHGGILLEHLKALGLHPDLGPGDRFFWFTTTGWMMWNFLVAGLLTGAAIVLYDGNPGTPTSARCGTSPRQTGVTCFGVGAPYIHACMKAGVEPGRRPRPVAPAGRRLDRVAALARGLRAGSTSSVGDGRGCPRSAAAPTSCTAFVGGMPARAGARRRDPGAAPRRRGRGVRRARPARSSARSASWSSPRRCRRCRSASGTTRTGRATARRTSTCSRACGGTATGSRSPSAASCVIHGRSDATLNRGGVRMGTAELYARCRRSTTWPTPGRRPRATAGHLAAAVRGPAPTAPS